MRIGMDELLIQILDTIKDEDKFNRLSKIIARTLNSELCEFYVYEDEKKRLRLIGTSSSDKSEVKNRKLKVEGIFEELARGRYVEYDDGMMVPVLVEGELVGAIYLKDGKLSLEILEDLMELSDKLGGFIKFLIEHDMLSDMNAKLKFIDGMGLIFNKLDDEDSMLGTFLEMVVKVIGAEKGIIWRREGKTFKISHTVGMEVGMVEIPELDEKNILLSSTESGIKIWVGSKNVKFLRDLLKIDVKSAMGCQINVAGENRAFVLLINRIEGPHYRPHKHFDESDASLLMRIVERLSLSLENLITRRKLSDELRKLDELRRRYEDLIVSQREQIRKLSALHKISQAMRTVRDMNNLVKILLLGLISEKGLGFDRALFLIREKETKLLRGKMWFSVEEKNLRRVLQRSFIYGDFARYLREESLSLELSDKLNRKAREITINYMGSPIFERVVMRKSMIHVTKENMENMDEEIIELARTMETEEFVCVPLIGNRETMGVLVLDNRISGRTFKEEDLRLLRLIGDSAGLSIESVLNYMEVNEKTIILERQKELVERLREFSEEILNSIDAAIIVIGNNRRIIEWNKKAEEFFGKTKAHMLGKSVESLGEKFEDLLKVAESVYDARNTIVLNDYPMEIFGKKFYDVKFTPLWNRKIDVIEGIIMMFEDTTQRHALEEELKKQEKLAALGEVTARVAHEIRNPLMVIGGFAERARKKAENPEVQEYLNVIKEEVKRLEGILRDILEYSKGSGYLEFSEFDLNQLVREVLTMFEEKIIEREIYLELDYEVDPLVVYADRKRIKQVILNLVKNAVEATSHGKISIRTWEEDEYSCFSIRNEAKPIPDDVKEKIFMPFFTTKVDGTGLGLPISKKIMEEEHNGKIELTTGENWNEFTIKIPKKGEGE